MRICPSVQPSLPQQCVSAPVPSLLVRGSVVEAAIQVLWYRGYSVLVLRRLACNCEKVRV